MREDEFSQSIVLLIEMARNGAIVTGSSTITDNFRQSCLENILALLVRDILPYLREHKYVFDNLIWDGLSDIGCLDQKKALQRG